jgi:uncharacterized protein (DUF1015 family)
LAKTRSTVCCQSAGQHFEIEDRLTARNRVLEITDLTAQLGQTSATPQLGMYLDGQTYLLRLRAGDTHLADMDAARSSAYNALDVTVLHTLILEKLLRIGQAELTAGAHVSYTIDANEARQKVDGGEYNAAFLLRSTPIEQVQEVACAGDKMPQKSTYFYPKVVTGLVLRPMD